MLPTNVREKLAGEIFRFVRRDFHPRFGELKGGFPSNDTWSRLIALGSELWFDTGDLGGAAKLWTSEFTALTTNNTLLNKEVQTGYYDDFVRQAGRILDAFPALDDRERRLEMAFILNARHGLRLVEKFDARVSVEEHTDLAMDADEAVSYALRYHEICPERFIVKIPFTPAGLLATRRLSDRKIPINHTLGFSARQNYVIGRIGRPMYVNVFLGRLNSFVADNGLGSGKFVGEKATLASQRVIRELRGRHGVESKQIGASFRSGEQVRDLMGIDVMTIPLKAAQEFLDLKIPPGEIRDKTAAVYEPDLNPGIDPAKVRLETLWDVDDRLVKCLDGLDRENLEAFTAGDLLGFFNDHGCGDVLVGWTDAEMARSMNEGKIPKLDNWRKDLESRRVGLDSLMNLAGLNSFMADQKAMDGRVKDVLAKQSAT
jgi:transaldolase